MNKKNIAEVIPLNIHLDKGFHYLVPPHLEEMADIGKRVKIPFRNKKRIGVIIEIIGETDVKNIKEIEEVIDPFPVISREVLALTDWISKYYLYPKGTIINHIIPSQTSRKKIASFLVNNSDIKNTEDSNMSKILLKENVFHKSNQPGTIFGNKKFENKNDAPKPLLFHYHNYKVRDRYYLEWIRKVVQQGKQVLILIPDQWCCTQLKKRMSEKYGKEFGIFDKKVNQTQKHLRFIRVERGDVKVVIGTRSNIYLPFQNLGLIIVEQENSLLYKEERAPRYNAREVALARGELGLFKVILGSFAPSIESYWQSKNQIYTIKTKKRLIQSHGNFPEVHIVNMEEEKSFQRIISFRLQQQIIQCLKVKDKVVLFINRRGFANYMVCSQCGRVIKCPDCNHLLSHHIEGNTKWVVCHICGKKVAMEQTCPSCGKGEIKSLGVGTQYVETLIRKMFPRKEIQRLDIDIAPRINNQKKITNEFNQGKIDILIGTQLLFRELNYQHVGLLGFILADHLLNIPDYRSAELSFQFIYQLALNFADRKKSKELLIQTYQPKHHSLQAIEQLNYPLFYQKEMMIRNELEYPPFTKMIKIDFVGKIRDQVQKNAIDFINYTHQSGLASKFELGFQISRENLIIVKEKDKNRASFVLRINSKKQTMDCFKERLFHYISKYQSHDVKLVIDVDPMKMY